MSAGGGTAAGTGTAPPAGVGRPRGESGANPERIRFEAGGVRPLPSDGGERPLGNPPGKAQVLQLCCPAEAHGTVRNALV